MIGEVKNGPEYWKQVEATARKVDHWPSWKTGDKMNATEVAARDRAKVRAGSDPTRGPWIQTCTGRAFYPSDPRPEYIDINDVAHALSMQCRFTGHVKKFYSVAEHSLRVSWLIDQRNRYGMTSTYQANDPR